MSRRSPLDTLAGREGEVLPVEERAFLGHINLRGEPADPAFLGAARSALGVDLPLRPNTVAGGPGLAAHWLGPDEWLVQVAGAARESLLLSLRTALLGRHAAVTDVTDGHTVVLLDHPRASEILSRGCPLDFHESVFPVGSCAQSVFTKAPVLLVREAPARFAITVRRSFARYFYHSLQDAGSFDCG
jgi:sarcosine oxidase subunit gamma